MGDGACFSRCSRTPASYYAGHQPDLTFFREVADQLQVIPATIVHGDLWTGNIAIAQVDRTIPLLIGEMRYGEWLASLSSTYY